MTRLGSLVRFQSCAQNCVHTERSFFMYTKFYIRIKIVLTLKRCLSRRKTAIFQPAASIKSPVFNEFSAWKTRAGGNFVESFNHRSLPSAKLCLTARFAARQNEGQPRTSESVNHVVTAHRRLFSLLSFSISFVIVHPLSVLRWKGGEKNGDYCCGRFRES